MSDRRYNEDEVAAIFERAIKAQQTQNAMIPLASSEGMTLGQLQEIGREIGLAPEQIEGAARAVARRGTSSSRKFLGFTIGVGRTVELDRKITEEEWEQLVVDLRETFDARGQLRSEGNFKQWTNGNLQALIEPTPGGHRLRLRTIRAASRAWMTGGVGMVVAGALMGLANALLILPNPENALATFVTFSIVGAGMVLAGAVQLPSWARLRRQQMEDVAARLADSTARGS